MIKYNNPYSDHIEHSVELNRYAWPLALNSCTDRLHSRQQALGIGEMIINQSFCVTRQQASAPHQKPENHE